MRVLFCRAYCITMKLCLIFCIFTDTPGTFPAVIAQITWTPSQPYTLLKCLSRISDTELISGKRELWGSHRAAHTSVV